MSLMLAVRAAQKEMSNDRISLSYNQGIQVLVLGLGGPLMSGVFLMDRLKQATYHISMQLTV